MAERRIVTWKSEGAHHFGVEPPVTYPQLFEFSEKLMLPAGGFFVSRRQERAEDGTPFSEFAYDSNSLPPRPADEAAIATALRLAAIIREYTGDEVMVQQSVHENSSGKHLFVEQTQIAS
jgi:hypothetical protein